MNILHAILLSIVEGLTEFLPVSSTGHLILASHFLSLPSSEFQKSFEIIIQLGAIFAVVLLYFKRFFLDFESWKKILTAFLPSAAISYFLYKTVKTYLLGNTQVVLWSLLIGGIIIIVFDKFYHPADETAPTGIRDMSYKHALIIGLCQTAAIIPGVSRSAATILGGLLLGAKRKTAVEFSFLLAVPTMLAASGYDFYKSHASFTSNEYVLLVAGFVGAFITALLAIKLFLAYIQKHNFTAFGIYRILIAAIYFIFVR